MYPKVLSFREGVNKKTGGAQWQARWSKRKDAGENVVVVCFVPDQRDPETRRILQELSAEIERCLIEVPVDSVISDRGDRRIERVRLRRRLSPDPREYRVVVKRYQGNLRLYLEVVGDDGANGSVVYLVDRGSPIQPKAGDRVEGRLWSLLGEATGNGRPAVCSVLLG